MDEELKEQIDKAIDGIMKTEFKPGARTKPDEAQKFSQTILNLVHAKVLLEGKKKPGQ